MIFHYRQGKAAFYRWDARIKTLFLFSYGLLAVLMPWPVVAVLLVPLAVLWSLAGLGVAEAWKGLRGFLFFLLYVSALPLIGAQDVVQQAYCAGQSLTRFLLLILASHLVVSTTTPAQISQAFRSFLSPLGKKRAETAALAAGLVINTLPRILSRAQSLKQAAQLRGGNLKKNPFLLLKIWSLPLISRLMLESEVIAWAIVLRGWESTDENSVSGHGSRPGNR